MLPKYLPGMEPDEIKPLLNMFFNELDKAYPDKHIILSEWDHEHWDRAAGTLCSFLGYERGKDFLVAYGYMVFENKEEEEQTRSKNAEQNAQAPVIELQPNQLEKVTEASKVPEDNPVVTTKCNGKKKEKPSLKNGKSNIKWIVIAIVVIVLFLILRGCGKSSKKSTGVESTPTASPVATVTVTSPDWTEPNSYITKELGGMQYDVGDTWAEKKSSNQEIYYYPYGDNYTNEAAILITYAEADTDNVSNTSLDTGTKSLLNSMAEKANATATYSKISDSDIDGRKSQNSSFELTTGQGKASGRILVIADDGKIFVLLCMQNNSLSDNMETAFSKVVSSVKFNEKTGDETEDTEEISTSSDVPGVRKEVKDFLDSYEAFIDEYVEFMSTYDANSTNSLSMLMEYTEILQKYAEFAETIDNYEEENDLTNEELAYYLEVTSRCTQKMLQVLQ